MKSETGINISEAIEGVSHEEIFTKLFNLAIQNRFSVAFWSLPEQESVHLIIDTEGHDTLEEIDLEELEKGFLFCPYDAETGSQVFIRKHISYSTDQNVPDITGPVESTVQKQVENIISEGRVEEFTASVNKYYCGQKDILADTAKEDYFKVVEESVDSIRSGIFDKVVPSKVKSLKLESGFNVIDNFFKLSTAYPRSFVYFVSVPNIGSWMGASPETIIEIEESKKFRTISLAGTQRINPEIPPGSVAWTQKEIEEQAMVSRYVINCFKKIRLREFVEKGPKTVVAGKLLHLKTIFEVDLEETGFHNLGTVMLKLLHPTSAVCGMPREAANSYLQRVEKHSRKYFCGFLGPVDNSHDTHLYVNLRCMELFEEEAVLYAGAGITEDSMPEKEWLETEIKCNTLLDMITGK